MTFEEQLKILKASRQFHRKWYAQTYPEAAAPGVDPAEHYLREGAQKGHNPGKFFDTAFYLSHYPDVAASGLNPLVHYETIGAAENRVFNSTRAAAVARREKAFARHRGPRLHPPASTPPNSAPPNSAPPNAVPPNAAPSPAPSTPPPATAPVAPRTRPDSPAGAPRAPADAQPRPAPDGPECPRCRARDTMAAQQDIARFLVDFAEAAGDTFGNATIWRLPSREGMRFAVAQGINSSFIATLRHQASLRGIACKAHQTPVVPNLYEFDEEPFIPDEAHFLEFHPEPHCDRGQSYLSERAVTLELVEERRKDVLVPMGGKGPRFYSNAAIARLAVTPQTLTTDDDWPFPIDLVYTWVDSADAAWQRDYAAHADEIKRAALLTAAASPSRWRSRDELRYSMRSIEMYAPFVRTIYIVTNGQRPAWLKDHPRVKVISHAELYPDPSVLPTFNSNNIETVLHRIPGLAEHFLYLNDDFLFARRCVPEDFFSIGGLSKLFFANRYLDARPPNPEGRATVACHKTTRDLLEARFGLSCAQKFQHAPHAMRKSLWERIETEFGAELARVRRNRVRTHDDLALALLYGYYALFTGYGHKDRIRYAYVELGADDIDDSFLRLEERRIKVFCLNDSDEAEAVSDAEEARLQGLLAARFPVPAAWERDDQPTPEAAIPAAAPAHRTPPSDGPAG